MKPFICPVCRGNGIVDAGFYTQTSGYWTSAGGFEMCRSCNGTGIVWDMSSNEVLNTNPNIVLEEDQKK